MLIVERFQHARRGGNRHSFNNTSHERAHERSQSVIYATANNIHLWVSYQNRLSRPRR